MDFEVQRFTRRCAKTDRELKPGESYYSALVPDGTEVKRVDFAVDAWSGPPEKSIGHWRSKMADPNNQKVTWAPNDVILHYFVELEDRPAAADTRYVLTLLMIRRRILRLEESETSEHGEEWLVVFCPKTESEYRVLVTDPSPERIIVIQDELANLLFGGNEKSEAVEDQPATEPEPSSDSTEP